MGMGETSMTNPMPAFADDYQDTYQELSEEDA
jgi:hypothetical protein